VIDIGDHHHSPLRARARETADRVRRIFTPRRVGARTARVVAVHHPRAARMHSSWKLGSRLGWYQAKLGKERHLVEIQVLGLDLAILNLED